MERGVKEAQTVSKTGRGEEQRSAYAIIRSFNVHCDEIDDKTKDSEKITILMNNVDAAVARKEAVIECIGEDAYNKAFEATKKHLHEEHFRKERLAGVIDSVIATADKNKPSNVRQKATGVTFTATNLDVFRYSWLVKADHMELLEAELKHRGFKDWIYPSDHAKAGKKLLWTDMKHELKSMEKKRVQEEFPGDVNKLAASEMGFHPQCEELEFLRVEKNS